MGSHLLQTPEQRWVAFWSRVSEDGDCLVWDKVTSRGYGQFWYRGKMQRAHRYSYTHTVGEMPEGLQLDHLCRNRLCVNPQHLEVVTQKENLLRGESFSAVNSRKTHCKRGHEFTPENTVYLPLGRGCKTCRKASWRAWYARQTA